MPRYKVKFEFFGHHMTTEVDAANESQARDAVKVRLNFHAVERIPQAVSDIIDDAEVSDLLNKLGYKPK